MVEKININDTDLTNGDVPVAPRLRINRSATLALTTSWQRVDFNGTAAANQNTYPMSTNGSNPMVYWDSTNKLMKFMSDVDRNYTLSLYLKTTSSSLINLINVTMATIQLRFVVPNGISPGINYYFPFPSEDELVDLQLVNSVTPWRQEYFSTIFADQRKRTNGVGIEVRLSNTVAGTVTLNSANLLLYGR